LVIDPFDERAGGLAETTAGEATGQMKGFGRSLPEQIARILREEIIERKVPPGSKLSEPALVGRFQTSRAPIREALYLLAQERLIERTPRKGALVKGYARQEISELYRVRITLEKMALERICKQPETIRACLAALEPIVRDMEKAEDAARHYHDLNFSFHKTIIILSQSDLLRRLYAQIEGPLKVVLRKSFSTEGAVPKSFGGHLQILDAIEQADPKRACQILHKHDEDGMRRALAVLPEYESTL
jgi:DNA-binding GntR family transcriptional regulator